MNTAATRGISYRQIIGLGLGLALVAGLVFVVFLVAFDSIETERGRSIQLEFCERQLSAVRGIALDAERFAAARDPVERRLIGAEIAAAADSMAAVHATVLTGEAGFAKLGETTTAFVAGLQELVKSAPGSADERVLVQRIRSAATTDLRSGLQELAAKLRLARDAAGQKTRRLQLGTLIVIILAVGAGLLFMYGRGRRDLAKAATSKSEVTAPGNALADAIESMSEGVALYDGDDRLVLCNGLYREQFAAAGIVLEPGRPFETTLREVVNHGLIADVGDDPEAWIGTRLEQHRNPRGPIKILLTSGRCLQIGEYQAGDSGIVTIQTDITEMEHREAARKAREEITRSIVDSVFDGIVTFDSEFQVDSLNPAAEAMFGYAADEIGGESFLRLLAEPFDAEYREALGRAFETDGVPQLDGIREILGRRKDGTTFPLEIAVGELRGTWTLPERRRTRRRVFIATTRDVSAQTELTRQLQQSQKMEAIGTLAGGIAHDFNNILSIILGYASLALESNKDEDDNRENLEMVVQAGRRARDLVDQILTFSRRSEHERVAVDLRLVVNEVLKLIRSTLPSTIEIRQNIGTEPAPVLADSSQLHQVIMNLCANAGQAMEEDGGLLEITLERTTLDGATSRRYGERPPGDYYELAIRDTGHGMAPAVLERIFEPFFTTKGVGRGTGLGLAVAHGIVSDHGGAIAVDSVVGAGSRFDVVIPAHDGPPAIASEGNRQQAPHGRGRILFVDDEPTLVRMADKVLTRLGYTVTGETESLAALERFRSDPAAFDLVVTDQTMPGMTGDALIRELRRCRDDIPVVVCTGLGQHFTAAMVEELNLAGFLRKPLMPHELGRIVGQALDH